MLEPCCKSTGKLFQLYSINGNAKRFNYYPHIKSLGDELNHNTAGFSWRACSAQKESWSDTQTTLTGSYCEPFLNSGALHPTSKRESRQPFGEKYLYLQFDSFCLTQFVSTGESRNAGWPVNPTELTVSVPEQASTEKAIHLQIGLQLTGGC